MRKQVAVINTNEIRNVAQEELESFLRRLHHSWDSSDIANWIDKLKKHVTSSNQGMRWFGKEGGLGKGGSVGAYCTLYPGRLGVITGPFQSPGQQESFVLGGGAKDDASKDLVSIGSRVVEALIEDARRTSVALVQTVYDERTDSPFLSSSLHAAGMRRLAILQQLFAPVSPWLRRKEAKVTTPIRPCHWLPYRTSEHAMWIALLERSYEGTMDCPQLNGVRATEDTWVGYSANANDDLSEWWVLTSGGQPIGILLMTKLDHRVWELTYMGVVPSERCKGWGRTLLEFAFERAALSNVEFLSLAADERNLPALELYSDFGFSMENRLEAWFWHPQGMQLESMQT